MRLTEKHLRFEMSGILAPLYWINENDVALEMHNGQYGGGNAIDKLGQLEDIEDELGIDLITLFKALKNGVYVKNYEDKILKVNFCYKEIRRTSLGIFDDKRGEWIPLRFKDYGKTWALTKEELL